MGDLSGRRELAELKPLINPPPHDLGAEQALLSGCMLSTDAVHAVLEMGVSKVTFYQQRHQGLFAGVLDCLERDVAIDLITF